MEPWWWPPVECKVECIYTLYSNRKLFIRRVLKCALYFVRLPRICDHVDWFGSSSKKYYYECRIRDGHHRETQVSRPFYSRICVWPLSLQIFVLTLLARQVFDVDVANDLLHYICNQMCTHLLSLSICFTDLGVYKTSLTHLMRRNVIFPNYTQLFNTWHH